MILKNDIILYHGSYTIVDKPKLNYCNIGKDFGKGLYLTTNKKQAERFVNTAVKKAKKNNLIGDNILCGYVNKFRVLDIEKLKIYEFQYADKKWLQCIASYRKEKSLKDINKMYNEYDVLVGKIANDTTNRVITSYIDGDFGDLKKQEVIQYTIGLLKPEKLVDQECFRTKKSLDCLKFISAYEVKINESK